jgi:hypothetical protein
MHVFNSRPSTPPAPPAPIKHYTSPSPLRNNCQPTAPPLQIVKRLPYPLTQCGCDMWMIKADQGCVAWEC